MMTAVWVGAMALLAATLWDQRHGGPPGGDGRA
jgi:hypothetical protein